MENVMWRRKWRPYLVKTINDKKKLAALEAKGDYSRLTIEQYYEPTAYDSRKDEKPLNGWRKLLPRRVQGGCFQVTPVPTDKYPELVPEDILAFTGEQLLQFYREERDTTKKKKKPVYRAKLEDKKVFSQYQHVQTAANTISLFGSVGGKQIIFSIFEKLSAIFWVFSFGGIGVWLLSLPVKLTLPSVPWSHMWFFLLVVLATVPAGYIFYLIAKLFQNWSGELRVFNRQTGMWNIPQGQKYALHIPFIECDPYWHIQATATGVSTYLWYIHKPTGRTQKMNGICRYQAFVHELYTRYFMDISKPLPDVPALEWCRSLDPITAEYDKSTNRPPRYWRDMPLDEMEKQFNKHRERVKRILAPEMAIDQQYLK